MSLSSFLRQQVQERAQGHCEYCRIPSDHASATFVVEHIIPRVAGGSDDSENLALSCPNCNSHKGAATEVIDPQTKQLTRLFHPRQDHWEEHFQWTNDEVEVEGVTAIGRATLARLQMNDPAVANLRHLLKLIDRHPPII
jgi:hypothetical protein